MATQTNTIEVMAQTLEDKPKPFIKWVGGKRQLLKQFKEKKLYPTSCFNHCTHTYFEPFIGGGAVFFDLLADNAVISDINTELICTYQTIQQNVESVIMALSNHVYDKDYYLKIRAQDPQHLSDVEISARFIYLNRTGFNGLYRVNKKGGFNVPFGSYLNPLICDAANLRNVAKALKNTVILNQDYKQSVEQASEGDFVYFDPPYFPLNKTSAFTAYTAEGFYEKEQLELRDTLVELDKRGCNVMLSNSDTPFINEIYSGLQNINIHNLLASRAINSKASGRGKITEVLITNY